MSDREIRDVLGAREVAEHWTRNWSWRDRVRKAASGRKRDAYEAIETQISAHYPNS